MFKLGDLVEWSSSAGGVQKTKVGKVELVIPAGGRIPPELRKEADAWGLPRDHESYLVRVSGKTVAAKGRLYWPRVSVLKGRSA